MAAVMMLGAGDVDADLDMDADLDLDGDVDAGDAVDGAGSVLASIFSFRTLVFAIAFFGVTGLIVPITGAGVVPTFVSAVGIGTLAGFTNDQLLRYIRRTSGDGRYTDDSLSGVMGRVSVPVEPGRRGRVMVEIDGRSVGLVAEPFQDLRDSFAEHDQVVVVEVKQGVARIAPMDIID